MFAEITTEVQLQLIGLAGTALGVLVVYLQKRYHTAEMYEAKTTGNDVKQVKHALGLSDSSSRLIDLWEAQAIARIAFNRQWLEEAMQVDPVLATTLRNEVNAEMEDLLASARRQFEAAHPKKEGGV